MPSRLICSLLQKRLNVARSLCSGWRAEPGAKAPGYTFRCLLLAALPLVSACEKEIDLDLRSTDPQLVIEATLADDGAPCRVTLRRSVNYTETNVFPAVGGAVVELRDATLGTQETLTETTPGTYVGATITGQVGHTYTLRVVADGRTCAATSTLPAPVPLTGLRLEEVTFGPDTRRVVVPEYEDPAGARQYYYFRQTVNGTLQKTLYLQTDELTDGRPNRQSLLSMDDDELKTGDSVRIELHNVDSVGYEYFRTLNQSLSSNPLFAATPANPISPFSGGALGYFSAYARQTRRIVVP